MLNTSYIHQVHIISLSNLVVAIPGFWIWVLRVLRGSFHYHSSEHSEYIIYYWEVKLPYDPSCPSVGRSVGLLS